MAAGKICSQVETSSSPNGSVCYAQLTMSNKEKVMHLLKIMQRCIDLWGNIRSPYVCLMTCLCIRQLSPAIQQFLNLLICHEHTNTPSHKLDGDHLTVRPYEKTLVTLSIATGAGKLEQSVNKIQLKIAFPPF